MAKKYKRISALDFADAIQESLNEYGSEAALILGDSIRDVTVQASDKLQQVRRFASDGHPTGEYSGDWTYDYKQSGRFSVSGTVYNMDNYRLTHLLEFGHVTRNGTGRTYGNTPAYPHIAPVNEWAQKEIINDVIRRLEKS